MIRVLTIALLFPCGAALSDSPEFGMLELPEPDDGISWAVSLVVLSRMRRKLT